jgi:hypothetical protein
MSFEDMTKKELVEVAEKFGVDPVGTKAKIIEALEAEGVTDEFYQNLLSATTTSGEQEVVEVVEKPAAPVLEPTGEEAIVHYTGNGSYRGPGITLSKDNPFAVVDSSLADALIAKNSELFRIASERQVEEFYN